MLGCPKEAHQVSGGFGGFFDLGDAAHCVVSSVELVGEDVGIGVDHAEEIVDGVGDGVEFAGLKAIHAGSYWIKRKGHGRTFLFGSVG